ncbi:hypothetical protein GCM10022284_68900 [Streptomyces hundungensis]
MGCEVAYLPGLTMRRIADLYPGEAKTDARDAFIIADTARAMPHALRSLELDDETVAELEMIVASTTIWPRKRPGSPTGSADCSHRSTHTPNGSWGRACSTLPY